MTVLPIHLWQFAYPDFTISFRVEGAEKRGAHSLCEKDCASWYALLVAQQANKRGRGTWLIHCNV